MTARRVLVCGGRNYSDRVRVFATLDRTNREREISLVIHGACCDREGRLRGADDLAQQWAIAREVPYAGMPAQWSRHGLQAGPVRNGRMLKAWKPDLVIAFPGGKGTADMVEQAEKECVAILEVPS